MDVIELGMRLSEIDSVTINFKDYYIVTRPNRVLHTTQTRLWREKFRD
jgi:hypothetical protein